MQIAKNKVVSIDYTLTNDAGETIDSSRANAPLQYLHGVGGLIPGLEKELEGKHAGHQMNVSIPPDQAYGHRSEEMVQAVPRQSFAGVADIRPGMQFQANTPQGPRTVTVVKATPDEVTVDANHPLAGQTLHFDVTVKNVRDATSEELAHGHVHGPGGHHH